MLFRRASGCKGLIGVSKSRRSFLDMRSECWQQQNGTKFGPVLCSLSGVRLSVLLFYLARFQRKIAKMQLFCFFLSVCLSVHVATRELQSGYY
jgi:hypothetical protein